MTKINNSSYFERLYYMDYMRQSSGCFGDKRDNPIFTCSGREEQYQQIYAKMYKNTDMSKMTFKEAQAYAKIQRRNNQFQYILASFQSLGNMIHSAAIGVKDILNLFGKKSS